MKVPVYSDEGVELAPLKPRQYQYENVNFDDGSEAVGKGMGQLGLQLEGLGEDRELRRAREVASARKQANEVAISDATTKYALFTQKSTLGFMERKGRDAADTRPVGDELEKIQKEIEVSLRDPEQRAAFRIRSNAIRSSAHQRLETHAAQQRVIAGEASKKASKAAALDAISNSYDDDATVETLAKVHGLALEGLTVEDREAAVADWLKEVVAVRFDRYLAASDVEGAQRLLEKDGELLGSDRAKATERLQKQLGPVLVERHADSILAASGKDMPEGWADENLVPKLLEGVPEDMRKDVSRSLVPRMAEAVDRRKRDLADAHNKAWALYGKGKWPAVRADPGVYTFLSKWDNEFLVKLEERWKDEGFQAVSRSMTRKDWSEKEARQKEPEYAATAMRYLRTLPPERLRLSVDELMGDWKWLSPEGKNAVDKERVRLLGVYNSGLQFDLNEFVNLYKAQAQPFVGDIKGKKEDELKAEAVKAYTDMLERNKGTKPTLEESKATISNMVLQKYRGGEKKAPEEKVPTTGSYDYLPFKVPSGLPPDTVWMTMPDGKSLPVHKSKIADALRRGGKLVR